MLRVRRNLAPVVISTVPQRPHPHVMSTTKQLDIRIGAVKRLTKEMKSRRVDVETEKQRTERLIAEGEDQWTVGKQVRFYL